MYGLLLFRIVPITSQNTHALWNSEFTLCEGHFWFEINPVVNNKMKNFTDRTALINNCNCPVICNFSFLCRQKLCSKSINYRYRHIPFVATREYHPSIHRFWHLLGEEIIRSVSILHLLLFIFYIRKNILHFNIIKLC